MYHLLVPIVETVRFALRIVSLVPFVISALRSTAGDRSFAVVQRRITNRIAALRAAAARHGETNEEELCLAFATVVVLRCDSLTASVVVVFAGRNGTSPLHCIE